jgi:hypothetical protein
MGCTIAMHYLVKSTTARATHPQLARITHLSAMIWRKSKGLLAVALLSGTALAQTVSIATLNDSLLNFVSDNSGPANLGAVTAAPAAVSPVVATTLPEAPSQHRFWDNENRALFAAVAALSAADFAVTRANLQNGGKELNPITRIFSGSTAGLAANFAGQTAGIIGLSYYFHRTGHHQLERITPMLNIGASSFAVVYDLSHR